MGDYLKSWLVRIGLVLIVGGTLPLVLVAAAADLGLSSDPHPNPIGLALLMLVTAPPGAICLLAGLVAVYNGRRNRQTPR